MAASSWVRIITSPIKKACTFFNPHHHRDKKSQQDQDQDQEQEQEQEFRVRNLQGEVMACGYEDVQVMWSILDMKAKPANYNLTS